MNEVESLLFVMEFCVCLQCVFCFSKLAFVSLRWQAEQVFRFEILMASVTREQLEWPSAYICRSGSDRSSNSEIPIWSPVLL
jgi:hypothetical protein